MPIKVATISVDNSGFGTTAQAAAASAVAAWDSIQDIYLGAKASDPTVDNDGNALTAGELYFNTSSNVMKYYDGSAWQTFAPTNASSITSGTLAFARLPTIKALGFAPASAGTLSPMATHPSFGTISQVAFTAASTSCIILGTLQGLAASASGYIYGRVGLAGMTFGATRSASIGTITSSDYALVQVMHAYTGLSVGASYTATLQGATSAAAAADGYGDVAVIN